MSAVRIPVELPPPLFGDSGETVTDTRSLYAPEKGSSRRRQFTRKSPRIVDVVYDLSYDQYKIFDLWWQISLQGGAKPFDLELWDDVYGLTWFTAICLQPYESSVSAQTDWRVSLKLLIIDESFGTIRPEDSEFMSGKARLGIRAVIGNLRPSLEIYGRFVSPFRASAVRLVDFYGRATVGIRDVRGVLEQVIIPEYPDLSRQWQGLTWYPIVASQEIRTSTELSSREWMETRYGIR